MPGWIAANDGYRAPDEDVLAAEIARCLRPFTHKPGDVNRLREQLMDLMWGDVGVVRQALRLPRTFVPQALLTIGYPAHSPPIPPRKPLDGLVTVL